MSLTREAFFAARPPKVLPVDVPELGGAAFVRGMTAGERDQFEAGHLKSKERDFRARLAAATVCDKDGNLLFTPADIPQLSALPAAVLEPLVQSAAVVSKLTPSDIEDLRGE